jgi:hypothetical protein
MDYSDAAQFKIFGINYTPRNAAMTNKIKAQLGVLFVHGIGQQQLGQTLTDFGEPFLQYLNDWLIKRSDIEIYNCVEINQSILTRQAILANVEKQSCPNFVADIQVNENGNCKKETWLFAESHWADSFHLPRNIKVALWLMIATPWACFTHAGRKIRIPWYRFLAAPKKLKIFHFFFSAVEILIQIYFAYLLWIFSLFIECLLVILALISLIPIPAILRYISWFHEKIAAVIGDSYIFVRSNVRRESAITQLNSDIEWIERHCDNIVIVAHSQGAALTYLALKKNINRKLKLLVTFGSGLDKLNTLLSPHIFKKALSLSIGSVMLFILTIIIPSIYFKNLNLLDISTTMTLSLIYYVCPIILYIFTFESNQEINTFKSNLINSGVSWMDIYSSADPVPSGPLFIKKEDNPAFIKNEDNPAKFESLCIWNERSIFSDHITYRKNRECFFASIFNAIIKLKLSDLIIDTKWHEEYILDYGQVARRIRSSGFKLTRYLLIFTIFFLMLNNELNNAWGSSLVKLFSKIGEFFNTTWLLSNCLTLFLVLVIFYFIISKFINITGNFKNMNQDLKLPRVYKFWYPKVSFQLIIYFIFGYYMLFWSIDKYASTLDNNVSFRHIKITIIVSIITVIFYVLWEFYNANKLCSKHMCKLYKFE